MKKALPPNAASVPGFNSRVVFAKVIFPLIVFAAIHSGGVAAYGTRLFEAQQSALMNRLEPKQNLFVSDSAVGSFNSFLSSLIVKIAFNAVNQPTSFEVGVPNPATLPLRVQTQNAGGSAETVSGAGWTVFLKITTTSPTGRFDINPTGGFTTNSMIVTITSGRSDSQSIYYKDTTPGNVVLTATVTDRANTGLSFGQTTSVAKSVIAVGENKLSFGSQPSSANKDATITPAVTVRVENSAGNLITTSTRNVTLAIGNNPSGGVLSGTTTVAAVGGIATFNNLQIDRAGNGYTLVASAPSPSPALTAATSLSFNINKLDQTIDFDELADKTYGDDDFEVSATSSSESNVVFSSQTEEVCTTKGNIVRIVAAGSCTIRASLAGDLDYNPAADVDRSFTIQKADATISVAPYDVTYNGEPHIATLVSITGVNGETGNDVGTVDLSGTVHTNARVYSTDQWLFFGNDNYNDISGTIENHIAKASVTAHAGGGSSIFDGGQKSPSSCVVNGPGFVGDLRCSNDPTTVGPDAGTYSIGSIVDGTGLSNFDIANIGNSYSIGKAPTLVIVTFESGPYVYRGSAFAASAKVTGAGGLDQSISPLSYSGDCVNVTVTNGCSASAAYAESANHLGNSGNSSVTISRKLLSVTASSHVLNFGDAVPNINASFNGLIAGENASVIDSLPTCSTTYTASSLVGTYPTTCTGGSDNNYAFAMPYLPGTVTVNSTCNSFNGFLAPIGGANAHPYMSGSGGSFKSPLRAFKLNSTIPFKFISTCVSSTFSKSGPTLSAQKFEFGSESARTNVGRFQVSNGQWHLNFKTSDLGDNAQGTWLFEVTLNDGSKYNVWLAIR